MIPLFHCLRQRPAVRDCADLIAFLAADVSIRGEEGTRWSTARDLHAISENLHGAVLAREQSQRRTAPQWKSSPGCICADACRRALPQLPCLARNCAEQACPGRKDWIVITQSRDGKQMEKLFRGRGGRLPVGCLCTGSPRLLQPKAVVLGGLG
jgi:hypothetical protein